MIRLVLLLLPLVIPGTALAQRPAAPNVTWPAAAYNPRPQPDDLVLPMPCGGAMAFRRVETPAGDGPLDDRPVLLGSADTETGYVEYLRRAFVVGPFGGGPQPRHFFMSKYEVTRAQFDALRQSSCPSATSPEARLPAVELSWFEALDAAQRYSTFLLRNAVSQLPRRGSAQAFVRLPTEAEWEYAARGGASVSDADFQARTFPMPQGIEAYAWFQGPRSANGRLSAIGRKEPNPLGLHDMLGNAAEWVLDPFQLNRVGRPQGQAGGLVVRGGDIMMQSGQLRSSLRIELAPFEPESGEPVRRDTIGFRLVLAAPAQGSLADTASLRSAFEAELRAGPSSQDNPTALLAALRREQSNPAMLQALDRLSAAYARETQERSDRTRAAARAQIQSAAVLSRNVLLAQQRANVIQAAVDDPASMGGRPEEAQVWRRLLTPIRAEVENGVRAYAATIAQIGSIGDLRIANEAAVVRQEVQAQGLAALLPHINLASQHAQAAQRGRIPNVAALRTDILRLDPNAQ